eukprot:scaffold5203_cov195-Alexandrium_tamarense.AAC.8
MTPVSETAWKFESALAGDSPSRIPDATYIEERMHKFVLPLISMDIEWSEKVYCTDTFTVTVKGKSCSESLALNNYLCVVNFAYPSSGEILLLSEYGANSMLEFCLNSAGIVQRMSQCLAFSTSAFFYNLKIQQLRKPFLRARQRQHPFTLMQWHRCSSSEAQFSYSGLETVCEALLCEYTPKSNQEYLYEV